MRVIQALEEIRQPWLSRVSRHLARGEELRENVEQLLQRFFHLLLQSIETGEPDWLDTVLDEWVQGRTETELENPDPSLSPILNQIQILTFEIARDNLGEGSALELIGALLPVFHHAYEYTSHKEITLNIEHMARELEKANATLQRLDRSKSDFIAIAAHELKTPLTLIEGYAAMLRDLLPRNDSYLQAWVLLKGVDNGTRRLHEIINDMIDVSLIDNNLLALHFQPVWLNRLLLGVQKEFAQTTVERNQSMEIVDFLGFDEMTFGDEERLHQAFRNLISNAVKYTPDGGKIWIGGRKLPGFIEVTVTDTGIGIALEDHARIFEKFGRLGKVSLHSSGKTKFKGGGPGLGLSITKGIIEAHGGAIWVESAGHDELSCPGSTFHVLLPIRKIPPDDKTAKLFPALSESEINEISQL